MASEESRAAEPASATLMGPSPPVPQSSLQIPPALASALREHQIAALHFMWHRLVDKGLLLTAARTHSSTLEQRALLYQEVYGCILGHSMGLGKTLTALSFVLLLQAQAMLMLLRRRQQAESRGGVAKRTGDAREGALCPALRVLVICPKSCIHHWLGSAKEWLRPDLFGRVSLPFYTVSGTAPKKLDALLQEFHTSGGVLILGYEEYVRLTKSLRQRPLSTDWNGERVWSILDGVRQRLPLRPKVRYIDILEGADVALLDEAHRLKRATSRPVQCLRRHLRNVQVRVALTGTPLQNHLEEYNVMQSVVTGSDLDTHQFNKYFVSPIQMGQCSDSSLQQFRDMQRCVSALRRYFASTVHRCGPEELERMLPPRKEFVFFFSLSQKQEEVYASLLKHFRSAQRGHELSGTALVLHHQASHVCLHPCLVDPARLANDSEVQNHTTSPNSALAEDRRGNEEHGKNAARHAAAKLTNAQKTAADAEDESEDSDSSSPDYAEDLLGAAGEGTFTGRHVSIADSPKLLFALNLVDHVTNVVGEKVVVFSLYLSHLHLMQTLLQDRLDPAEHDMPNLFTGYTSEAQRAAYTADFQTNPRRRVMLCSVRAGGVGINLTAANHCIMLDVSWNPSDDTQATYRVFRFGQRRPVTIYRLATRGTTEQVVFAYALQKSWLHKKIADVTDPARQERHMKRSYFTYPCRVPIDDGAPRVAAAAAHPANDAAGTSRRHKKKRHRDSCAAAAETVQREKEARQEKEEEESRARYFLGTCEKECPNAAAVLRADPVLQRSLYSLVRRSFLLRDDSADTVAEMESRFRETQRRKEAQMPIALVDEDDSLVAAARLGGVGQNRKGPGSLLEECETELVDTARTAANHVIWYVMQRRHDAGLLDQEAETTAVVRETDRALCALLHPLIEVPLSAAGAVASAQPTFSFQDMQSTVVSSPRPPRSFTALAEVFLHAYQEGAYHAVTSILSQGSFSKLRTYLTSRIPREAFAASSRRPRRSTLTHGVLEDALLYRPYELFSRVDPIEHTYLDTEMGFVRPFVEQCVLLGVRQCLMRVATLVTSDAVGQRLAAAMRSLLKEYFCEWRSSTAAGSPFASADSDSDSDSASSEGVDRTGRHFTLSQAEAVSWRLDVLAPRLTQTMERCLNDLWPSGAGFDLPPICLQLAKEEQRTARSFHMADRLSSNVGSIPPGEAAAILNMTRSQVRSSCFTCPRCKNSLLVRTADTVFGCALCHYNAEAALCSNAQCQQSVTLFQLSFTCNLLDTFSISRSFSTAFLPSDCAGVWDALLKLRAGQPMFHLIEKCTKDGIDLMLTEYPAKYVQLLALQSGAGDDIDLLRRMLLANASLVWSERLRKHVRDGLAACFRDLVEPCGLTAYASMPLMSIILSLYLAARHEEVNFAAELLEGDQASNVYSASVTGGRRRALLRFACDCLVKLLYAEKLLTHCRAPPAPKDGKGTGEAEMSEHRGKTDANGGFSDLDDLALSTSSSQSSNGDLQDARAVRRAAPQPGKSSKPSKASLKALVRQPSSSSSSSSVSSRSHSRPRHKKTRLERRQLQPRRGHEPRRLRSGSPSSSSSWHLSSDPETSSSSFGTCYSSDRDSFAKAPDVAGSRRRSVGSSDGSVDAVQGSPNCPSAQRDADATPGDGEECEARTAEELEDEATLEQRSAQYWVAFCEVYGTRSVDTLTVFVEDEELGMTILPPPPSLFWVSQLMKASKDGKTISQVIDMFLVKLLDLSKNTRLITDL